MFSLTFFVSLILSKLSAVPIIVDSDFGGPIDDPFAISYLIKKQCDRTFNIRLISLVGRNATRRTWTLAKFLQETGYSDQIEIGIGENGACGDFFSINCVGPIWEWFEQFNGWNINDYDGVIHSDGINRMIQIIEEYSPNNPVYVVTLGAMTNLATIINLRPDLKQNMKIFTMSGSLFDDTEPFGKFAEFNILDDVYSAQIVYNDRDIQPFAAPICAVPWDTGYYLQITGESYQRLLDGKKNDLLISNLMEMYDIWYVNGGSHFDTGRIFHPNNATASMYDLQTVWLAAYVANLDGTESEKTCESVDYLIMESFDVYVDDDGLLVDIYDPDDTLEEVWFAAKWESSDALINIAADIVDTLLSFKNCNAKTSAPIKDGNPMENGDGTDGTDGDQDNQDTNNADTNTVAYHGYNGHSVRKIKSVEPETQHITIDNVDSAIMTFRSCWIIIAWSMLLFML